ncbi:MAG: glycoside hydrolase family 13 protein [Clostridiales Family XIII bacterium]|jgi:glycosidase|nr:glycoside hydrolase family 13 protein [Clostridiales Family XIII bacterium]
MDSITFGSVTISDVNIVHDSAKERYRQPFGAVAAGTEVRLSLQINGLHIERALLCVIRDGAASRIELYADGNLLSARYVMPQTGCVLWYWFEIVLRDGSVAYYGSETGDNSGLGRIYRNPPPSFQITVHESGFVTPAWAKKAILYQIFPDRFHRGDPESARAGVLQHREKGRGEIELHEQWDETPVYTAKDGRLYYMPSDVFGGDLAGIRQRLPYLKELGVTLIYLNPIFEAASNHRYNTGDYRKIDPILGDEAAFSALVREARAHGIRLILDGVFSHTGDDSVYFNRYGRYDSVGAYQSESSPYFGWYKFSSFPDKYESWWGFESLPEVNEYNAEWIDFIIENEDSVLAHWISLGAGGFRLDVADELPDDTVERIRGALKRADGDAFLLGEVWEDATTKQSYQIPRRYALGGGLDSVMNYPFLTRTADFLMGRINAYTYRKFLVSQRLNYPKEMYYTLMNLLSSHDVPRIRTVLSREVNPQGMTREQQAVYEVTPAENALGARRQGLAAAIQFSLPGIPSVYYGDEVGMTGLLDPFNRKTWREEHPAILGWYKKLAALRRAHPVLSTGHALFYSTNGNVFGVLRYTIGGRDAFGEEIGMDAVLTVVNPSPVSHRIVIDLAQEKECLPFEHLEIIRSLKGTMAESLVQSRTVPMESGLLDIRMEPYTADILRLSWDAADGGE